MRTLKSCKIDRKGEYDDDSLKARDFLIVYPHISVDGIGGSSLVLL